MKKIYPLIALAALLVACGPRQEQQAENAKTDPVAITDGRSLVRAMHQRWDGVWCPNQRFEQVVQFYESEKPTRKEVWQELIMAPGKLHIRYNGFDTGHGAIYRNDSVYRFKDGALERAEATVHHLMLMAIDVFFQDPEHTIATLEALGYDLDTYTYIAHEIGFEGGMHVVGTTSAHDDESQQFWVDKNGLYLRRIKYRVGEDMYDVHLYEYRQYGSCPTATELNFFKNTDMVLEERYFNISFPQQVDSRMFSPAAFGSVEAF